MKASEALLDAARQAEKEAEWLTKQGRPEDAELARRSAANYRRLAHNHRQAARYQGKPELDPEQVELPGDNGAPDPIC